MQRKMIFNTCNGRCELQKSLKKFDDNEKKMQHSLKEKTELVYILDALHNTFKLIEPIEIKAGFMAGSDNKPVSVSSGTFRPPSFFI